MVNRKNMKTAIKFSCIIVAVFGLWSCSGDDSKSNNDNGNSTPNVEFTNTQRQFANLNSNFFKPDSGEYKGIVVLGSGNDPEDPTAGDINEGYLVNLSKKLAVKGYLVAIVNYRDEPPVGANWENWTSNVEMLSTDLSNTGNAIAQEFGLERSDIVLGGSSYAANALLSNAAWGNVLQGTKGFIAIMGSCAVDTAQSIKLPVLAYACKDEPYNDHYGKTIYDNIENSNVKNLSYGMTDSSCSGHSTSNNWQDDIVSRVQAWLP
jgi:hypothetical protein